MATTTLVCPIDDLSMVATRVLMGDTTPGRARGGHVHITAAVFTCTNGHQWRSDDITLNRVV